MDLPILLFHPLQMTNVLLNFSASRSKVFEIKTFHEFPPFLSCFLKGVYTNRRVQNSVELGLIGCNRVQRGLVRNVIISTSLSDAPQV